MADTNSIGTPKEVSQIIDMPMEEFKSYVKHIPNLTELLGLKKTLELEYQKVERVKNDTLDLQKTSVAKKDTETEQRCKDSLEKLYAVLMLIEEKCTVIETEKNRRAV